MKAAYQVAVDHGNEETFILSSVFPSMVDELIKTTDRFVDIFTRADF